VNHKRVERLMAAHGIVGHRPGRRRGLTKADTATHPRRIWWAGCLPLSSRTAVGAELQVRQRRHLATMIDA
jgi:hypothetical protein